LAKIVDILTGRTEWIFLSIINIHSKTAASIFANVLQVCTAWNISMDKVASAGVDGASVMSGPKTGVIARLMERCTILLAFHCVAHRGALVLKGAVSQIPYLVTFFEICEEAYRANHYSSVRQQQLIDVQEEHSLKVLKHKDASFTREWSSWDAVTNFISRRFAELIIAWHRAKPSDAIAKGLLFAMNRMEFVYTLTLLRDILPSAAKLSQIAQTRDVDICLYAQEIEVFKARCEKLLDEPYSGK
jgi:hypothetical protein